MEEKIYLGKVKKDFRSGNGKSCLAGEKIWLQKHEWDCDWYFGLGYIGNKDVHTHFNHELLESAPVLASEIFEDSQFTNAEWWIIRDLMIQAYALKAAADVYQHGGHQTSADGITDVIRSNEWAGCINKDLERVLDTAWIFMGGCIEGQTVIREAIAKVDKQIEGLREKQDRLCEEHNKAKNTLKGLKAQLNDDVKITPVESKNPCIGCEREHAHNNYDICGACEHAR